MAVRKTVCAQRDRRDRSICDMNTTILGKRLTTYFQDGNPNHGFVRDGENRTGLPCHLREKRLHSASKIMKGLSAGESYLIGRSLPQSQEFRPSALDLRLSQTLPLAIGEFHQPIVTHGGKAGAFRQSNRSLPGALQRTCKHRGDVNGRHGTGQVLCLHFTAGGHWRIALSLITSRPVPLGLCVANQKQR